MTAVVVARVDAVGPARWTTSDGRQPDDPFAGDAQIVTPVVLELAESVTGDLAPGTLRVHLLGGTVGCSSLRMSGLPEPQLVVGHRYAFFLDRITTSAPPSDGLSLRIFDAWEVDAAGVVHTCCEGDLTLGTFRAAVIAAAAAHPRPTD